MYGGYSLEPPRRGSTCIHNLCFKQKYDTYSGDNFQFLEHKKNIVYYMGMFSKCNSRVLTVHAHKNRSLINTQLFFINTPHLLIC